MPNVRKKGKKFIGAWIPEKLHQRLQALAAQRGCALSDVIDELLTGYAESQPTEVRPRHSAVEISKNKTVESNSAEKAAGQIVTVLAKKVRKPKVGDSPK